MRPRLLAFAAFGIAYASHAVADERVGVRVEYRHEGIEVHYNLGTEYGQEASLTSPIDAEKSWTVAVTPTKADKGNIKVKIAVTEGEQPVSAATLIVKPGDPAEIHLINDDGDHSELKVMAMPESWGRPTKLLVYKFHSMDAKVGAAAADKLLADAELVDPRVRVQVNPKTNSVIVAAMPEDLDKIRALLEGMEPAQ